MIDTNKYLALFLIFQKNCKMKAKNKNNSLLLFLAIYYISHKLKPIVYKPLLLDRLHKSLFWVALYFVLTKVSPFGNLVTKIAMSQTGLETCSLLSTCCQITLNIHTITIPRLPDKDWSANKSFVNTGVFDNPMLFTFPKQTHPDRLQAWDPTENSWHLVSDKAPGTAAPSEKLPRFSEHA